MKAGVAARRWAEVRSRAGNRAEAAAEAEAADLVARLAAGDEAALREVYVEHQSSVRAFANRLIGDVDAAEDLVHEVFVALPRAARRFRGETSLRRYLIGMAVNHARHHVRGAVRRRRAQQRLVHEPAPSPVAPDRLVESRELGRALLAALDELPLEQRVAFVLCELDGASSIEAARIVGTSDGNVRLRLFHARRALRRSLAGWHGGASRLGTRSEPGKEDDE